MNLQKSNKNNKFVHSIGKLNRSHSMIDMKSKREREQYMKNQEKGQEKKTEENKSECFTMDEVYNCADRTIYEEPRKRTRKKDRRE
jgi:hypothetical protein